MFQVSRQNQQDNEHRNIIREQILRKGYAHQYYIRRFIPCGREKANQILAQECLEARKRREEYNQQESVQIDYLNM